MPNSTYLTEFAGLRTVDFLSREALDTRLSLSGSTSPPPDDLFTAAKADPGAFAWRLRLMSHGDEEDFRTYLERFIDEIDTAAVTALIVGDCWNPGLANDNVNGVRDLLIEHGEAFPALRALFFGEVTEETQRLSWVAQTDVSPLLAAFPGLHEFTVRGGDEMTFRARDGRLTFRLAWDVSRLEELRRLTFQSHRLDPALVRAVLATDLPVLEHLEFYLGSSDGGGASPEDLATVFAGSNLPALKSLGLRNGQATDGLVAALADAPVTRRLAVLDLSLGTLTDKGAQVLLDTPVFLGLDRLDVHHHYMSEEMTERLRGRFTEAGVGIRVGGRQERDEHHDEPDDEYEEPSYCPAIVD